MELPLKLCCWVVLFLFLQDWGLSCVFICFCFKMFCSWKGGGWESLGTGPLLAVECCFFLPLVHGGAWLRSDVAEGTCGGTGALSLVFW